MRDAVAVFISYNNVIVHFCIVFANLCCVRLMVYSYSLVSLVLSGMVAVFICKLNRAEMDYLQCF